MPVPNAKPRVEKSLDAEARRPGAKLTAVEVASFLRIHPSTVYRMAKRGELPGFKIGTDWRFSPGDIREWLKSRTRGPNG
jgi:excisionase family DNA binding protein